jgi:hypothetical protein
MDNFIAACKDLVTKNDTALVIRGAFARANLSAALSDRASA